MYLSLDKLENNQYSCDGNSDVAGRALKKADELFHVFSANAGVENEVKTYCKDCGVETTSGPGSARCKECWDARFGEEK